MSFDHEHQGYAAFCFKASSTTFGYSSTYTGVDLYTLSAPAGITSFYTSSRQQTAAPGGQAVGSSNGPGSPHALLWNGSSTAVDLNPTNLNGFNGSYAYGTNGTQQVGYGQGPTTAQHALLWNGSGIATDLHPSGFTYSGAFGTNGTQQVGYGVRPNNAVDALLWNGTSTAIDLNPTNLSGITTSCAYSTNGIQQVGYGSGPGTGSNAHALLWNGNSTAIDLNALLPAGFTSSDAWSLDAAGNVFGTALDTSGNTHAIEWAVPEPTGLSLIAFGAAVLLARRRRVAA